MKPTKNTRRALLIALLASSTAVASTGCSSRGFSMASMNPFSKSTPAIGEAGDKPGMTESIAAGASGAGNTAKSVGDSAKGVFSKTTSAVAGIFKRDTAEADAKVDKSDPLRLDNRPDQVDPEVFVANGQLWESTGDMTKAMESYTRALEANPKHAPALTSLARLHFRQGNLPQAVSYFERALVEKPADAGLHNDLGLTLSKLGKQTAAVASLEKALQLAPGTSRYANNLASVKFESGDPNSALMVLMQNNKPAVAHFNMAYLHFKKNQMPQAQNHLSEAMKFEPQATTDPATGRAIERSRQMLAQIQGAVPSTNPNFPSNVGAIASTNAKPGTSGAKIQAPMSGTPGYAVPSQQAVPSAMAKTGVASTSSMGPAMAAITPPAQSGPAQPPAQSGPAQSGPAQSPPAPTLVQSPNAAVAQTTPAPATWRGAASGPVAASEAVVKTASTATSGKWGSWNQAISGTIDASTPAPIRPTSGTSSVSEPAADASKEAIQSSTPSTSFTLPEGFSMPASK